MEFPEFEKLPPDAQAIVLFSEIRAMREHFSALLAAQPEAIAAKLAGQFQTKAGCEAARVECKGGAVPWGKLVAGLLVALSLALTAYSQTATPAKPTTPPAVRAPR